MDAMKLTENSGKEVPKATNVNPITILEMPNLVAMDVAPSIVKFAPLIKNINPTSNNAI